MQDHQLLVRLQEQLIASHDLAELNELCFRLGIRSESISGKTIDERTRELVEYCMRRGVLRRLAEEARIARPQAFVFVDDAFLQRLDALQAGSAVEADGVAQHPRLSIAAHRFANVQIIDGGRNKVSLQMQMRFTVETDTLTPVEELQMGVVAYDCSPAAAEMMQNLVEQIDARGIAERLGDNPHHLVHFPLRLKNPDKHLFDPSFFSTQVDRRPTIPLSHGDQSYVPCRWQAAAYLLAKDTPLVWYQLELPIDEELLKTMKKDGWAALNRREPPFLKFSLVERGQPVVAWSAIN